MSQSHVFWGSLRGYFILRGVFMADFGRVAVKAVQICSADKKDPRTAWDTACKEKDCPRNTFLGLCEDGFVRNVPKGNYTRSKKNKSYGIAAVKMLAKDPLLANDLDSLWEAVREIVPDRCDTHNGQMDVVIALWVNNMINQNAPENEK
jgi:hypothetical protein